MFFYQPILPFRNPGHCVTSIIWVQQLTRSSIYVVVLLNRLFIVILIIRVRNWKTFVSQIPRNSFRAKYITFGAMEHLSWAMHVAILMRKLSLGWSTDQHSRLHSAIQGNFGGSEYDSDFPPPRVFSNSNKCRKFASFISDTIVERLQNGSINCVGKVGVDQPPYIVAPLTVEPNKPRLCVNLMYLNNWIVDRPFTLDTLKDVPRVVNDNAWFTLLDDKSGFDNVRLHNSSFPLVGFQWAGYYFVCKTLPFGFKLSSYIYHKINLH